MRYLIPYQDRSLGLWDEFFTDFTPAIKVKTDKHNVYVSAEVAGIDKKDINIEYEDNTLTITGEKKTEKEEKREGYYYSEISSGKFSRRINVGNVDFAKAKAECKDGILEVTLPKAEVEKAKKLEIE